MKRCGNCKHWALKMSHSMLGSCSVPLPFFAGPKMDGESIYTHHTEGQRCRCWKAKK